MSTTVPIRKDSACFWGRDLNFSENESGQNKIFAFALYQIRAEVSYLKCP